MNRWWSHFFRESNAGSASGGGGGGTQTAPQYTSQNIKDLAKAVADEPDLSAAVAAAIERAGGNKEKGIAYALRQGYKARKQRDEVIAENKRVAASVATDKDVLLKGEDASHVKSIIEKAKKAGLSLADLASKIETLPQTETRLKELEDERTAARAAGGKFNQKALAKAVTDDGYVFIEKDVTTKAKDSEGKDVTKTEKVWHVKRADEKDDKAITVDKYVDEHVFSAAIKSKNGSAQSDASSSVEWPSQGTASGGGPVNDLVGKALEANRQRAEAPSALGFAFSGHSTPPHSGAGGAQDAARKS